TLETQNLPILSTLKGWKYGFESPFKAEVYFVNTKRFNDLKWGTKNPIMLRDPEFGPVRLRAFGTYEIKVDKADTFLKEIVGTDGHFTTDEITNQLRNMIVSRFTDLLGESKIPILDLAANYDELGTFVTERIAPEFEAYGLEMSKLLVENISLPPAVEEALDKRSSMGVVGNLAAYTQFQSANAIEDLAQNPGGGGIASGGMGMGMGFAMANQMGQALNQPGQQQPQGGGGMPPPLPNQQISFFAAIGGQQAGPFDAAQLQQQIQGGAITRDTLVWKQGMPNWTAAKDVPELTSFFGAVPPPLPPG
ncbi:MAG: SPFH domain-containing protein, partial [Planctomycetota bacterium]